MLCVPCGTFPIQAEGGADGKVLSACSSLKPIVSFVIRQRLMHSVRQKWNLVQTLCEDISGQDTAQLEMPAWHADVLELREERIALGEASWMPIEDAIRSLEAKFA
jgi:hypothetical protein